MINTYNVSVFRKVSSQLGVRRKTQETKYILRINNGQDYLVEESNHQSIPSASRRFSELFFFNHLNNGHGQIYFLHYSSPRNSAGNLRDLRDEEVSLLNKRLSEDIEKKH